MIGPASAGTALPDASLTWVTGEILLYGFAMLRVGAFMVSAPFFGARFMPLQVRILASAVVALPIMAHAPLPDPATLATLRAVPMVLEEIAIGLTAGLVLTLIFAAVAMAGDRIASSSGLGFASQFDPTGAGQTPVVSEIFNMFMLAIFVAGNGHLAALRLVMESYHNVPPGSPIHISALIGAGIAAGGQMFVIAARLMLPVAGAMVLINMGVGVMTRSAPQINIFSFGFPVTMGAAILLLYITTPGLARALEALSRSAVGTLQTALGALGHG